jgi:hypothetical protein
MLHPMCARAAKVQRGAGLGAKVPRVQSLLRTIISLTDGGGSYGPDFPSDCDALLLMPHIARHAGEVEALETRFFGPRSGVLPACALC